MHFDEYQKYSHRYWMSKALSFIEDENKGLKEVPVAALVVKNDKLIAKAVNKIEKLSDATAHAEILAIREASKELGDWRLNECILYVTLEPCAMCAGAIINSRISKLVFGAYDINYGVCGASFNLFSELRKNDQIEIIGGILEEEASQILKKCFLQKRF